MSVSTRPEAPQLRWSRKRPTWGKYKVRICGTVTEDVRVCERRVYFDDGTSLSVEDAHNEDTEWAYVGSL